MSRHEALVVAEIETDAGEYSLLQVRSIELDTGDEPGDAANES
ncbi:MAG: hypothetical protein ACWGPN_13410 [Gammaproteobacteria bacterium]